MFVVLIISFNFSIYIIGHFFNNLFVSFRSSSLYPSSDSLGYEQLLSDELTSKGLYLFDLFHRKAGSSPSNSQLPQIFSVQKVQT